MSVDDAIKVLSSANILYLLAMLYLLDRSPHRFLKFQVWPGCASVDMMPYRQQMAVQLFASSLPVVSFEVMITILIKLMLLIGEVVIGSFVQTVLSHSIQGCGIIYGPSSLSSGEWLKLSPQM